MVKVKRFLYIFVPVEQNHPQVGVREGCGQGVALILRPALRRRSKHIPLRRRHDDGVDDGRLKGQGHGHGADDGQEGQEGNGDKMTEVEQLILMGVTRRFNPLNTI